MSPRLFVGLLWVAVAIVALAMPARADAPTQLYTLAGSDAFQLDARHVQTLMTYEGTQILTCQALAGETRFHATVTYRQHDGSESTLGHAAYALRMTPAGQISDEENADPDYLTILNQPFSVQLDRPTMRDLHALARPVPFDFPSPMTGTPLHGSLRRLLDRTFNGVRVLGIAFSAHGPLAGTLPDRPTLAVSGTITMNGTAYYAYTNALLLALDATLLIEGKVGGPTASDTVTIRYKRSIRPATVERRGR
jgi:hypothetical protein